MLPSSQISKAAGQHQNVYDLVQGFIGLLSPEGMLLDANQSSLEFVGANLGDVVGKPFWETPWWCDSQSSQEALKEAIKNGAAGRPSRFEALHTDKSGKVIFVDFSLTPLFDDAGTVVSLLPEARDITAVKEATLALQESETRLQLACDIAGIGTWDWDLSNDHLRWDDRQFRLFGIQKNKDRMDGERAISAIHPDDRNRVRQAVADSAESGVPFRQEFRVTHQNGDVRWLVGCGDTVRDDKIGKPISMIGINYDITERKKAETKLAQSNLDLEARVAERTRQLEQEMREHHQAQEALAHARRLDLIGQLAGGVAHDFNNLLAVIGGNLELAALRMADDQVEELIHDALDAVEAGASLNQRLLSFASKRSLNPSRMIVNARIEGVRQLLERTLDENIALETALEPDIWETFVDAGELDSAILNLAVNARDAMPSGGKLRIVSRNQTLDEKDVTSIPGAQAGRYIQLAISDTGSGMTPEVLEKAVTPFFTTKEAGKGSGLGLSSVFGFARQSGGFVTIESTVGKGTTVTVNLPRLTVRSEGKKEASSEDSLPQGFGRFVLVVEDDAAVRKVTHNRLVELGYNVVEAATATEAVNLLQTNETVSLLFSDIRMPGQLSGYDLAKWLYENRPDIKVLLTSGYDAFRINGRQGASKHNVKILAKPYSMRKLAMALHDALLSTTDIQ